MRLYTNYIKAHWEMIALHAAVAIICFVVADSALEVLLLAPVLLYAMSAVSVDIEQNGYAMLVILSEEPDIEVAKRLSEELVEEVERDVKTVIIAGDSLQELRDRLMADEEEDV